MARIKLGPVVTDIAGSIGGLTIQRNKFGITARAKPLPLRSESPSQSYIRQKISSLQYSWQSLTDAQRLQWNRFLDFSGQTIKRDRSILLSGQTLYIKYQLWRLLNTRPLLTTIAYSPMPSHETLLWIHRDATPDLRLAFSGTVQSGTYFFIVKVSSPRSRSQAFSRRGLRLMVPAFATASSYVITNPYVAAFGAIPPLQSRVHYEVRYFSMSAPVYTGISSGIAVVTLV